MQRIAGKSVQQQPVLPTARVIPLTDFDQLSPLFSNWQGRFEQLSSGRFEGMLRVVQGRTVRVLAIAGNQRVMLRGREAAKLFSVYPVIAENATSVWQGRRLRPGQLVVHGINADTNHTSARQTKDYGMSLRPEALQVAIRALLNSDDATLPPTWAALSPAPDAFDSLNRQLTRLLSMGVADPTLLESPEGHRLEQECVRSLVAALFSTAVPKQRLSLPGRTRLVRLAEELMRARIADPFGAVDLCRELSVSERTLRLAFRERYGLGPMAYYKCLRLNAVRSRLKSNALIAVATAAHENGFHHLGNFAADYRRLFGERPSETRIHDFLCSPVSV